MKSDVQLEELQLQSGGTFTPRVSYYLHHHLVEEKDFYARVGQEIGEHFAGGFVYHGRTTAATTDIGRFDDRFIRAGGDAFVRIQKVAVSGSVLYGRDDNPLGTGERRTFYGGFAEGDVYLNDRTVVLARIDAVHQNLPALFSTTDEGWKRVVSC